jgi:AsmA protein
VDGPGGVLARADRVVLTVGAGALFGGEVAITSVEVSGLHAVAGRDSNGRNLWTLAQGPEGGAAVSGLDLQTVVVRDGSFDWADAQAGRAVLITGVQARAARGSVEVQAVVNGQPVQLVAEADDAAALWNAGSVVRGQLDAGDTQVLFDGRAGLSPVFAEGQVTADAADLAAVAALAGEPVPDLPAGLGRDLRQVKGQLTRTAEGSWHLREATIALDGNRLSAAADLTFDGPRPRLAAQVEGTELDVVLDGARPAVPLAALLTAADADVGLRLGMFTLDGRAMGPVRAEARVDRARAEIALREAGLFGGRLAGEVVLNARSALSVSGELAMAGVDLAAAASAFGWSDRVSGRADARLSFAGEGDTAAAVVAGLDGAGRLGIGDATLQGTDLAALFRLADAQQAQGTTQIDLATASFTLDGGVLSSGDLRLEAADVALAGTAAVGLAARTLDLRVAPVRLTADDPAPPLVPLRVAGTWAAPGLAFDLSVLAERELAIERARAAELPVPTDVVPLSGTR